VFRQVQKPQPSAAARARDGVYWAVRQRWFHFGAGGLVVLTLVMFVGAFSVWTVAVSDECAPLQHADLTLRQIGDLKHRVEAHEADESGELVLSGEEASFLIADNLHYPIWMTLDGSNVVATLALQDNGRCYNVEFEGQINIEDGVANIVPDLLVVGGLDLTRVTGTQDFDLEPDDLKSPHAQRLLSQTRHLQIRDSHMHIMVSNLGSLR
jgi:hypothetical protein